MSLVHRCCRGQNGKRRLNLHSGMGSGSVAMIRKPGSDYAIEYKRTELQNVAKETRGMPDEYICEKGNDITKAFIDYASPLIGELPPYGRLKGMI